MYAFDSGNQHGVLPNGLLIAPTTVTGLGTVWRGYDPRTGVLTSMNVTNVPSGTAQAATLAPSSASSVSVAGPSGELLIYALTNCGTTAKPAIICLNGTLLELLVEEILLHQLTGILETYPPTAQLLQDHQEQTPIGMELRGLIVP